MFLYSPKGILTISIKSILGLVFSFQLKKFVVLLFLILHSLQFVEPISPFRVYHVKDFGNMFEHLCPEAVGFNKIS